MNFINSNNEIAHDQFEIVFGEIEEKIEVEDDYEDISLVHIEVNNQQKKRMCVHCVVCEG